MASSTPSCGLCLSERAPYTCPRCLLRYCSASCYRGHGDCAQDFQRRQLSLQLQGRREEDPASRRRLAEALLRLRELREPGDAAFQLGLDPDLDPEAEGLWERLRPEQRRAFQRLLSSGGASALLPPWRPWWEGGGQGEALVQELEGPEEQREDPLQPPGVPASIPPLGSLSRGPVSPLVGFQVPNVLFAYAYATALYHGQGDQAELLPEFCGTLLDVSGALGAQRVFHSTAEALQDALQALTAARYPQCSLGNAGVMLAVAQILTGAGRARRKGYSLAAFAHLSGLLGRARRRLPAQDRPRVYRAKKKCDFLLSWVNEHEETLVLLAVEVQREHQAHRDTAKEVGVVTRELEKMWGGKVPPPKKPLIEELDVGPSQSADTRQAAGQEPGC